MAKRQDVVVLLDPMIDFRSQLNPDGTVKGVDAPEGYRILGWPNPDLATSPVEFIWDDEGARGG